MLSHPAPRRGHALRPDHLPRFRQAVASPSPAQSRGFAPGRHGQAGTNTSRIGRNRGIHARHVAGSGERPQPFEADSHDSSIPASGSKSFHSSRAKPQAHASPEAIRHLENDIFQGMTIGTAAPPTPASIQISPIRRQDIGKCFCIEPACFMIVKHRSRLGAGPGDASDLVGRFLNGCATIGGAAGRPGSGWVLRPGDAGREPRGDRVGHHRDDRAPAWRFTC